MSALLSTLLPLVLKYLLPLISAWLAARGHANLSATPDASGAAFQQLYAAWGGIAAAGVASGETLAHLARKRAAGAISPQQWQKVFELLLQLLQIVLTPEQSRQIHAALGNAFPDVAKEIGLRR